MSEPIADSVAAAAALSELYVTLVRERDLESYWRTTGSRERPAHVVAIVFAAATPDKTGAMYFPNDGNPIIEIYRPGWIAPVEYLPAEVAAGAADPLRELVLLAHELGHHDLVVRGLGCGLFDEGQPVTTYEEEVGAWMVARKILQSRDFREWGYFDQDERKRLDEYRLGLGIEDPVPIEERVRRTLEAG
jgi:hypothetical protein